MAIFAENGFAGPGLYLLVRPRWGVGHMFRISFPIKKNILLSISAVKTNYLSFLPMISLLVRDSA